jgi:hypothetical protein
MERPLPGLRLRPGHSGMDLGGVIVILRLAPFCWANCNVSKLLLSNDFYPLAVTRQAKTLSGRTGVAFLANRPILMAVLKWQSAHCLTVRSCDLCAVFSRSH